MARDLCFDDILCFVQSSTNCCIYFLYGTKESVRKTIQVFSLFLSSIFRCLRKVFSLPKDPANLCTKQHNGKNFSFMLKHSLYIYLKQRLHIYA